jgi:hypothetical protein
MKGRVVRESKNASPETVSQNTFSFTKLYDGSQINVLRQKIEGHSGLASFKLDAQSVTRGLPFREIE